jgi:DNA-binding NarL/FixJ family response regulator
MSATSFRPRKLAYIEDDARFRFHFGKLINEVDASLSVTTFGSAEAFLSEVERFHALGEPLPWSVVFMDLGLPKMGGVEAIAALKDLYPKTAVLALTVFEDPQRILAAIAAGADGYLLKSLPADALARDLDQALRYGAGFSPALAEAVLDLIRKGRPPGTGDSPGLSKRQIDVLRGLSEGDSYRAIAERLGLSIDTVRSHVRHIYAFLHVRTAREAVTKALRRNLI